MTEEPDTAEYLELIPFDAERDGDLVEAWFREPHVSEWWGDPDEALVEVLERPHGGGDALIVVDDVPVGYIRWETPTRKELDAAGLHEVPGDVVEIDIAIGEGDRLGQGIGSRAVGMVRDRLTAQGVRMIIIVPSVNNVRAIRAYEKAGFKRIRQFADPECGLCWLMAFGMSHG